MRYCILLTAFILNRGQCCRRTEVGIEKLATSPLENVFAPTQEQVRVLQYVLTSRPSNRSAAIIMHGIESLREIRWMDYFLFGGVPAQPEPMYCLGSYRYSAAVRHTRKTGDRIPARRHQSEGEVVAIIKYNLATRKVTVSSPMKEE